MKTKSLCVTTLMLVCFGTMMVSCGGKSNNAVQSPTETATGVVAQTRTVFDISDSVINHSVADTISFGRLKEGETAVREIAIRNAGDVPLVLVDFMKTCGCVSIDYDRKPIMPSETGNVKFTFDSRGIQGWVYKTIIMKTSLDAGQHLFIVTAEVSGEK